tara:strand:+ start:477 stop:1010 length:534 start_codon:yes stop_codon:yes gene_type:complete
MVDSVKNYGIAGASTTVELGRQGAVIDATSSSVISMKDTGGSLENVAIADGTSATHGVTKSQLDEISGTKISYKEVTVSYNSGTATLGTTSGNVTIQRTVVEKSTNWTSYNDTTNIQVGDSGDVDRLFTGFTPDTSQYADDSNHTYTSSTVLNAIVTQGGAVAGTAKVRLWYNGVIV